MMRPNAGGELEPDDERPRIERRPFGVSHHGLRCMPISVAPRRISRKAWLRFSYVASSGESPTTTAAAAASGAAASSWVSSRWPSNSRFGVVRGEDVERLAGKVPGRVRGRRRQCRQEPFGRDLRAELAATRTTGVARLTADVLVTMRYGMPVDSRRAMASTEPGISCPVATITPSMSRSRARVPARAAAQGRYGGGPDAVSPSSPDGRLPRRRRAGGRMGLLDGKTALIFGVANDHSIAWGIARALHDEGAEVGFSLDREPDREARPAARGRRSARPSSSRATSSPTSRSPGSSAAGARATTRSTSWSTPSPSRGARTSRARSSTRRATGSRWRSTSRRTRWWRSRARRGRYSTAARRS